MRLSSLSAANPTFRRTSQDLAPTIGRNKLFLVNAIRIAVLITLVYGNPVLLLWTWVRRFKRGKSSAPKWRITMLWVSMVLATAAVLAFWVTLFVASSSEPQRELVMKIGTRLSLLVGFAAILTAVFGEGPERKRVAFSSLVIPFHWIMASVWQ
jgi:peptidoglycan biosynthesis protein MviN/MurJ (putative lipid II flippase)